MKRKKDLIEITHLAFGKKRTVSIWGRKATKVFRQNLLYQTGQARKFHSLPFVRLKGNLSQRAFLKLLLEKGVPTLDCIIFARILPSEIVSVLKEDI